MLFLLLAAVSFFILALQAKSAKMILFVFLFIVRSHLKSVVGFGIPKSEFLLDIDGNSIATGREHVCVIEKKQGNSVGGRAKCFGYDHFEGRTRAPQDVSFQHLTNIDSNS